MTCIVGMVGSAGYGTNEPRVMLGGDSAGTSLDAGKEHQITEASSKVYRVGAAVYGVMGSSRVADVIRYEVAPRFGWHLDGDEIAHGSAAHRANEIVVAQFIPLLIERLQVAKALMTRDRHKAMNGHLLLGLRGHLFWIGSDFAVSEPVDGFYAIGTGRDVALGALHAQSTAWAGTPFRDRPQVLVLGSALEAAAYYVPSVRGPFSYVVTTPYDAQEARQDAARAEARAREQVASAENTGGKTSGALLVSTARKQ